MISYLGLEIDLNFSIAAQPPLEIIFAEIEGCLSAGLYFAAVSLALGLPDVCSSLATDKDETARFRIEKRYVAWCDAWLAEEFNVFSAADCWALRGGVLHNGCFNTHPNSQYARLYFTLPDPNMFMHENTTAIDGGSLQLDAQAFCRAIIQGARKWYTANQEDAKVKANLPHLVRFRPMGMLPDIWGTPVIG